MGAFVHLKYRPEGGLRQAARRFGASGHADEAAEAFTHGDEEDPPEVPAACAKCHSAPGYKDFLGMDGSEAGVDLDATSEELGLINIRYYAAAASRLGTMVKGGYEYEGPGSVHA